MGWMHENRLVVWDCLWLKGSLFVSTNIWDLISPAQNLRNMKSEIWPIFITLCDSYEWDNIGALCNTLGPDRWNPLAKQRWRYPLTHNCMTRSIPSCSMCIVIHQNICHILCCTHIPAFRISENRIWIIRNPAYRFGSNHTISYRAEPGLSSTMKLNKSL